MVNINNEALFLADNKLLSPLFGCGQLLSDYRRSRLNGSSAAGFSINSPWVKRRELQLQQPRLQEPRLRQPGLREPPLSEPQLKKP